MNSTIMNVITNISAIVIHFFSSQIVYSLILFACVFSLIKLFKLKSHFLLFGLWTFIFIRLLLPPDLSFGLSGRMLLQQIFPAINRPAALAQPLDEKSLGTQAESVQILNTSQKNVLHPADGHLTLVLFILWLSGFVMLSSTYLRRLAAYRRLIRQSIACTNNQINSLVVRWQNLFGIDRHVQLRFGEQQISPFTMGMRRPVIYMPYIFHVQYDINTIETVIAHEMSHIKHYDTLWIKLQNFIQFIYFFNPVVWLAGRQIQQIREEMCDAAVLSKQVLSKKAYGYGLLNVVQIGLPESNHLLIQPGFSNRKQLLTQRIQHIKNATLIHKSQVIISVSALAILAVLLLPMADKSHFALHPQSDKLILTSPVPDGQIVLECGNDWDRDSKAFYFHKGVDIVNGSNQIDILAAAAGTIVSTGQDEIFHQFWEITVQHQNGYKTRYLHLTSLSVTPGDIVTQGQKIGGTGFCLHFEVLKDGVVQDPADYLSLQKKLIRHVKKD
ncbi:peptidoglycan DD-metalloendopeptidase family protein [candidate division KSB1 bacterium]|nr:peptidoglycan DD-metalloendopeptidase family protein [candidate division KSB1 bacterium]